jgi:hypothetical protein
MRSGASDGSEDERYTRIKRKNWDGDIILKFKCIAHCSGRTAVDRGLSRASDGLGYAQGKEMVISNYQ